MVDGMPKFAMLLAHKALVDALTEKGKERVVETALIQNYDRLREKAEPLRSQSLE